MPTPRKGESKSKFVSRCIGVVKGENSKLTDKQASGRCYGIWDEHQKRKSLRASLDIKALSLQQMLSLVRADWEMAYGMSPPYLYPSFIYEDYIILEYGGRYVRVEYEIQDGVAVFADLED